MVQEDAPYMGDMAGSRLIVQSQTGSTYTVTGIGTTDPTNGQLIPDYGWMGARVGDRIELGLQGHVFQITSAPTGADGRINQAPNQTNWTLRCLTSSLRVSIPDEGAPFKLYREPITVPGQSVELPDSVAIDLQYSGTGDDNEFRAYQNVGSNRCFTDLPVLIMFDGQGAVSEVRYGGHVDSTPYRFPTSEAVVKFIPPSGRSISATNSMTPSEPIYLLIGKNEGLSVPQNLINAPGQPLASVLDLTSVWVSIHHTTGKVQSSPNTNNGTTYFLRDIRASAAQAQGLGGR